MMFFHSIREWLLQNRTTVRMAFVLRMVALGIGSVAGLIWTRLLLGTMGAEIYGLFLSFSAVTRLGGLGELGLTGTVALKAGQYLGAGNTEQLEKLLATARALFGMIALILMSVFLIGAPWLPTWLHFRSDTAAGSLPMLFATGGIGAAIMVVSGYFSSLNYAHGTVTWPILPTMLLLQIAAPFFHWWLAACGAPLWIQNTPYLIAGAINTYLIWRMLKWSHPTLGNLLPLALDRPTLRLLFSTGGWMYLAGLGAAIYQTVDRLVINAYFGADQVPAYQLNYKLCELSLVLITTATFVAVPKITQWIASQPVPYERLHSEIRRLRAFQVALSLAAGLGYLWINDHFIRWWVGPEFQVSLGLQAAFAATLVVAGCGECGTAIAARCGKNGVRSYGLAVGLSGVLNLVLSLVAAHFGSLAGIAIATAISQCALVLAMNYLSNSYLRMAYLPWLVRTFAFPLAVILGAIALRSIFPSDSWSNQITLAAIYFVVWIVACRMAGLSYAMLSEEIRVLWGMVKGRK